MRQLAILVLVTTGLSGHAAQAADPVIADAVNGFVRPAYAGFEKSASQMHGAMDALCAARSGPAHSAANDAFVALVASWSRVEPIRFGPITEENRLERILFWPDRKSIGLKQVQAALSDKDASAADPGTLKSKSVAMQGLGALEFVLFGTGSETLDAAGDPYRCRYGLAVAQNIEAMATAVSAGWNDPKGIAGSWQSPEPNSPLYRDAAEARSELLDIFVNGLEMTRDVRLKGFLGAAPDQDKPKQAIFWRSGATGTSLRGNMEGMRDLFDAAKFGRLLPAESGWIAQSIDFEFRTSSQFLGIASGPIAEVLGDKRRDALAVVGQVTSHLSDLFGTNLAGALNLTAGFSSLDGD